MLVPARRFNFLDDPFFYEGETNKLMSTDITENDKQYELHMELPGFKKENIEIELDNGNLKIHAKNEQNNEAKEKGKVIRQERFYGELSRSFYVGDNIDVDNIDASFEDGILKLVVPKKEIKDNKKFIELK